jgi:hypothetical protein
MKPVVITPIDPTFNRDAWLDLLRRHLTAADWPKITGSARRGTQADVVADKRPGSPQAASPDRPQDPLPDLVPLIREQVRKLLGPGRYLEGGLVARGHLGFVPHLARIDRDADWVATILVASVLPWKGEVPAETRDQAQFQAMVLGVDRVLVIHLQLASWEEGQAMLEAGLVPAGRLVTYKVEAPAPERDRLERQAAHWWKRHVLGWQMTGDHSLAPCPPS